MELNPPIVSDSNPPIEPLLSKIKTTSTILFLFLIIVFAKVLFVIITDGLENASKEYNSSTVKKLIETQKEKYGWEFLFLGANIDAIETANTIGISAERAVNYKSDSIGTKKNYDTLNKAVEEVRSGKDLDKNWKADIEADYNERNKK